jgi:hypothetical protein
MNSVYIFFVKDTIHTLYTTRFHVHIEHEREVWWVSFHFLFSIDNEHTINPSQGLRNIEIERADEKASKPHVSNKGNRVEVNRSCRIPSSRDMSFAMRE